MLFGALLLQYAKMEGEDTFSLHFWQLHAHSPPSTKKKKKCWCHELFWHAGILVDRYVFVAHFFGIIV